MNPSVSPKAYPILCATGRLPQRTEEGNGTLCRANAELWALCFRRNRESLSGLLREMGEVWELGAWLKEFG